MDIFHGIGVCQYFLRIGIPCIVLAVVATLIYEFFIRGWLTNYLFFWMCYGRKKGPTAWMRKAISDSRKGKRMV
jgi:hypothetical protein